MNSLYEQAYDKVLGANTIALTTHINTDGDAVGSTLGLYHYLVSIGKNVDVFIDSVIPENLITLDGVSEINNKKFKNYDLLICLDSADEFRLGKNRNLYLDYKLYSIQFDHHDTANSSYAKLNIVEKISSTCELVAEFLFEMKATITKEIARCLITGIYTDTGRLSYSSVSPETFIVVSKLLDEANMNIEEVTYSLNNSLTYKEFLIRKMAYTKVEFYENNSIAIVCLTYEDIQRYDIELFMTKSLIDIVLPLKDVKLIALMTEFTPNTVFCSFRSKGDISAKSLAEIYGGGGHLNAAGCKIRRCIVEAEKKNIIEQATRLIRSSN